MFKVCTKCKLAKSFSDFPRDSRKAIGIAAACKICKNRENRDRMKRSGFRAKQRLRVKNCMVSLREMIQQNKHNTPCFDCGIKYPFWIMHYDHTRGIKIVNLSLAQHGRGKKRVLEEMAKCDIVCGNCHHIRTYIRYQITKSPRNMHVGKIKKLLEIKETYPCSDCGIKYRYYVMQFDHVRGEKEFGVSQNQMYRHTWNEILQEIKKCDLVCSNCHAQRTYLRKSNCAPTN